MEDEDRTNMLWSVQLQQLNTTRKLWDESSVGRGHDDRPLRDAHKCFNGAPETTVVAQNNINLQTKRPRSITQHAHFTLHQRLTFYNSVQLSICFQERFFVEPY